MRALDVLPSDEIAEEAAKACVEGDRWQEALSVLKVMLKELQPRKVVYDAAIQACVRKGRWRIALSLLEGMAWVELRPDTVTFDHVLECIHQKPDSWNSSSGDRREIFFRELLASIGSNQSLCRTALRACGRRGRWQEALEAVRGFQEQGVALDPETVVAAMRAAGGCWQAAFELFEGLQSQGAVDLEAYRALIHAYEQGGAPDRVLKLLQDTREMVLAPDPIMYQAAISACPKQGAAAWIPLLVNDSLAALKADSEARFASGRPPDAAAFRAVIRSVGECQRWEEALRLLDEFECLQADLDTGVYNAAVHACTKARQTSQVIPLIDEMLEWKVQPDALAFAAGVYEHQVQGRLKERKQLHVTSYLTGANPQWLLGSTMLNVSALPHEVVPWAIRTALASKKSTYVVIHTGGEHKGGTGKRSDWEEADQSVKDIVHWVCKEYGVEPQDHGPGIMGIQTPSSSWRLSLARRAAKLDPKNREKPKMKTAGGLQMPKRRSSKLRKQWPEDLAFKG